jgi:hypothetical protein
MPIPLYYYPASAPLALLHLVQLRNLVQQLARLLRIRYPRRRARQPRLEVVRPSTQELVAHMQRLGPFNRPKDALTRQHPPALVPNVHKHVVSACCPVSTRLPAISSQQHLPLKAQNGSRCPTSDISYPCVNLVL